jgi:hypothetical protein
MSMIFFPSEALSGIGTAAMQAEQENEGPSLSAIDVVAFSVFYVGIPTSLHTVL